MGLQNPPGPDEAHGGVLPGHGLEPKRPGHIVWAAKDQKTPSCAHVGPFIIYVPRCIVSFRLACLLLFVSFGPN